MVQVRRAGMEEELVAEPAVALVAEVVLTIGFRSLISLMFRLVLWYHDLISYFNLQASWLSDEFNLTQNRVEL